MTRWCLPKGPIFSGAWNAAMASMCTIHLDGERFAENDLEETPELKPLGS